MHACSERRHSTSQLASLCLPGTPWTSPMCSCRTDDVLCRRAYHAISPAGLSAVLPLHGAAVAASSVRLMPAVQSDSASKRPLAPLCPTEADQVCMQRVRHGSDDPAAHAPSTSRLEHRRAAAPGSVNRVPAAAGLAVRIPLLELRSADQLTQPFLFCCSGSSSTGSWAWSTSTSTTTAARTTS